MAKHLSPEEIGQLLESKITGDAFADALLHIEQCGACRRLLPPSTNREIIERLLPEYADFFAESACRKRQSLRPARFSKK